jgi:DNA-binding MarR family transcriptional regulator
MDVPIDKQLQEFEALQDRNWQRLVFNLRKHLDIWAHLNVDLTWVKMKLSYFPVLCNIAVDGNTPSEISEKSMITKQNVSRTLKELTQHGMVSTIVNKSDKRSEIVVLTQQGKQTVLEANINTFKLLDTYAKIVGKKELDTTIKVLNQILDFHIAQFTNR